MRKMRGKQEIEVKKEQEKNRRKKEGEEKEEEEEVVEEKENEERRRKEEMEKEEEEGRGGKGGKALALLRFAGDVSLERPPALRHNAAQQQQQQAAGEEEEKEEEEKGEGAAGERPNPGHKSIIAMGITALTQSRRLSPSNQKLGRSMIGVEGTCHDGFGHELVYNAKLALISSSSTFWR
ncbi:hypothetical protein C0J45_19241 [Silurus meridionalis]|nr:hypothetical protein C0J45_19241 [Silurus meridionalis]